MNLVAKRCVVSLIILVAILLIVYFFEWHKEILIKKNLTFSTAVVTKVSNFDRYHHNRVDYCFKTKSKTIICSYVFIDEISINQLSKLQNHNLKVAYDSLNPYNCVILIREKDIKKYK
jgi:hypothetical protein